MAVFEVDSDLIVGDVETDLLAVVEVDSHLIVGDVETDLLTVVEVDLTDLLQVEVIRHNHVQTLHNIVIIVSLKITT